MKHGKKINHLGRKNSHRKSMLSNMANSLIKNKRIFTTLQKAKSLSRYIEPILTKSKIDNIHSRRIIYKYLKNKSSILILFKEISNKINNRNGGYTRIIKINNRIGDRADLAMIELVDFNEKKIDNVQKKNKRSRYTKSITNNVTKK